MPFLKTKAFEQPITCQINCADAIPFPVFQATHSNPKRTNPQPILKTNSAMYLLLSVAISFYNIVLLLWSCVITTNWIRFAHRVQAPPRARPAALPPAGLGSALTAVVGHRPAPAWRVPREASAPQAKAESNVYTWFVIFCVATGNLYPAPFSALLLKLLFSMRDA